MSTLEILNKIKFELKQKIDDLNINSINSLEANVDDVFKIGRSNGLYDALRIVLDEMESSLKYNSRS